MHFYLHTLTDTERIRDPDGQECDDLEGARREASLSARELMANELQEGRPVPLGWHIHVADADDTVLATISFVQVALGGAAPADRWPIARQTAQLIANTREIIAKVRERQAAVDTGIGEAHSRLRTLVSQNEALDAALK